VVGDGQNLLRQVLRLQTSLAIGTVLVLVQNEGERRAGGVS